MGIFFSSILILYFTIYLINLACSKLKNEVQLIKLATLILSLAAFAIAIKLHNEIVRLGGTEVYLWEWLQIGGVKLRIILLFDEMTSLYTILVTMISLFLFLIFYCYNDDESSGTSKRFSQVAIMNMFLLFLISSGSYLSVILSLECLTIIRFFFYEKEINLKKNRFFVERVSNLILMLGFAGLIYTFKIDSFNALKALKISGVKTPEVFNLSLMGVVIAVMLRNMIFPFSVKNKEKHRRYNSIDGNTLSLMMVLTGTIPILRLHHLFGLNEKIALLLVVGGLITFVVQILRTLRYRYVLDIISSITLSHVALTLSLVGLGRNASAIIFSFLISLNIFILFNLFYMLEKTERKDNNLLLYGESISKEKVIFWCFGISILSFVGFPGLASYYIFQDLLISLYMKQNFSLFYLYTIGLGISSFCLFRILFVLFFKRRENYVQNEVSKSLTWVMGFIILLCAVNIVMIMFSINIFDFSREGLLTTFLSKAVPQKNDQMVTGWSSSLLMIFSIASGGILSYVVFVKNNRGGSLSRWWIKIGDVIENNFFIDEYFKKYVVSMTKKSILMAKEFIEEKIFSKVIGTIDFIMYGVSATLSVFNYRSFSKELLLIVGLFLTILIFIKDIYLDK